MSLSTERALNLLRVIEKAEEISQRELAERVDVSLGTANQTIRALVGKGFWKPMLSQHQKVSVVKPIILLQLGRNSGSNLRSSVYRNVSETFGALRPR